MHAKDLLSYQFHNTAVYTADRAMSMTLTSAGTIKQVSLLAYSNDVIGLSNSCQSQWTDKTSRMTLSAEFIKLHVTHGLDIPY